LVDGESAGAEPGRGPAEAAGPVGDEPSPLAEAKLAAPRVRPEIIHRPRVVRALDAGEETGLTLVAAPAGYGKTTAVREWCAGRGAPVAWVTLDELADDTPVAKLVADVEQELEEAQHRAGSGELLERPSEAELAVLRLLGTELSAAQIGGELFLSANTVRSHLRVLYRKLGVNSRADAVARATTLGLLDETGSPR
jgi:ATP/maltotriose-dependent transcriptional regulator MalT